jgi:hypothetical protein
MKLKIHESLIPKYYDQPRSVYGVVFPSVFVAISICAGYELFINNTRHKSVVSSIHIMKYPITQFNYAILSLTRINIAQV